MKNKTSQKNIFIKDTSLVISPLSSIHYAAVKLPINSVQLYAIKMLVERKFQHIKEEHQGVAFPTFTERYLEQGLVLPARLIRAFASYSEAFLAWLAPDLKIRVKNNSIGPIWANVHWAGQYHASHNHALGEYVLSGVFYVSSPPNIRGNEGCLILETGLLPGIGGRFDLLYRPDAKVVIKPTPGTLVLFPSFVRHYVSPHMKSCSRISIAFNVRSDVVLGRKNHG